MRRFAWILFACAAMAQAPNLSVTSGVAATSRAAWTRISVRGEPEDAWLTLQCIKTVEGMKQADIFFEIGQTPAFWMPHEQQAKEQPLPLTKLTFTFDAYKPMRREWVEVRNNQFLYNRPGAHSGNMEPVDFYLKFMGSTTTMTVFKDRDTSWSFPTRPLLKAMTEQDLCKP